MCEMDSKTEINVSIQPDGRVLVSLSDGKYTTHLLLGDAKTARWLANELLAAAYEARAPE